MGNNIASKIEDPDGISSSQGLENITSYLLRCKQDSLMNNEGLGACW